MVDGDSYIKHIDGFKIKELLSNGAEFTSDFSVAESCDALILCVPTPLNKYREPDLSYVTNTCDSLIPYLRGGQVLVLGIAYKKNVDDMRESPSVELMSLLQERGAHIAYSDPYVPTFPKMRDYQFDLQSVQITPESLVEYDCVLIATNHDGFDYESILRHSSLIVDTRGVYEVSANNVLKA